MNQYMDRNNKEWIVVNSNEVTLCWQLATTIKKTGN